MNLLHVWFGLAPLELGQVNGVSTRFPKALAGLSDIGGKTICNIAIKCHRPSLLQSGFVIKPVLASVVVERASVQVPLQAHRLVVRRLRHVALAVHLGHGLIFRRVVFEYFLSVRAHLGTDAGAHVPRNLLPVLPEESNCYNKKRLIRCELLPLVSDLDAVRMRRKPGERS